MCNESVDKVLSDKSFRVKYAEFTFEYPNGLFRINGLCDIILFTLIVALSKDSDNEPTKTRLSLLYAV